MLRSGAACVGFESYECGVWGRVSRTFIQSRNSHRIWTSGKPEPLLQVHTPTHASYSGLSLVFPHLWLNSPWLDHCKPRPWTSWATHPSFHPQSQFQAACGGCSEGSAEYSLKCKEGWGRQLPTQQVFSGSYLAVQKGHVCVSNSWCLLVMPWNHPVPDRAISMLGIDLRRQNAIMGAWESGISLNATITA